LLKTNTLSSSLENLYQLHTKYLLESIKEKYRLAKGNKSIRKIKKSSEKKMKPKIKNKGKYLYIDKLKLTSLIFNIIIINKKRTATAPTYTTIKRKAKNSAPKQTKNPATLKKTKIRPNTECTGFFETITIKEDKIENKERI